MSNTNTHTTTNEDDDMLPEYDFSQGVRGKHAKEYSQGPTVTVTQLDETQIVDRFPQWDDTTLGEVIELKRGYDLPQAKRQPGNVPLVSSSGISDFHSEAAVKGPGVITGRYGTIGQVYYVESDFWPLNTTLYVKDFKGNDPRFISYFLRTVDFFAYSDKAAVPGVNRNHLHQARVRLPPLPEQRAIASILGALDDKIELNRRMNRTLEEMARALFQSWFVDFDPVRAKAERRETGLPAEIAALFPDRFVESELGEIPEGWGAKTIGDIGRNIRRTIRPEQILPTAAYIGLEHMPQRSIALAEWSSAADLESNKYEFLCGEILFGKLRPYFHKVGVAPCDGVCSTDILVIAPAASHLFAVVLGYISSVKLIEFVNASSTGTKMPRTNWEDISRYKIVLPRNAALPEALNNTVTSLTDQIRSNIHQSMALARLRDALLPKLISGELRVLEAEELIEEAVA